MNHPHSLIFAGTPDFAATILAGLLSANYRVLAVLTQPDRPAGRGRKPRPSAVKQLADQYDIPILQPQSLKDEEVQSQLTALAPEALVVAAYGLLLPPAVLSLPRYGCINVHASLLPRWRGAAPIQRALLAGDKESGISIMQMDEGLDTGDILTLARCPVFPEDTAGSLHDRLAKLGSQTLNSTLEQLGSEPLRASAQDNLQANYAERLSKQEGELNWKLPAATLERQVRAFNPWPVSYTTCDQSRLRIWQARYIPHDTGEPPGTVIATSADGIDVATGDGLLRLQTVQRPGGRALKARDYLNAVSLPIGAQLG